MIASADFCLADRSNLAGLDLHSDSEKAVSQIVSHAGWTSLKEGRKRLQGMRTGTTDQDVGTSAVDRILVQYGSAFRSDGIMEDVGPRRFWASERSPANSRDVRAAARSSSATELVSGSRSGTPAMLLSRTGPAGIGGNVVCCPSPEAAARSGSRESGPIEAGRAAARRRCEGTRVQTARRVCSDSTRRGSSSAGNLRSGDPLRVTVCVSAWSL